MTQLEPLLVVQEHDTAADSLRHRRATLPEREVLIKAEAEITELAPILADARGRRDLVARDVSRLEDEASSTAAKAKEVEKTMYSGSISSPRELQAMQADVEQLERHRSSLEDRELELMERQETLDAEVAELEGRDAAARASSQRARDDLAAKEGAIDAELEAELAARTAAAEPLPADLITLYERCRAQAKGIGAARLLGNTCQGCRLTIPASEVDRIRRHANGDTVIHCDNCGAILVPDD